MKRGNRGNEDGFVGGEDAEGVSVGAEEDVSAVAIVVSLEEGGDLVDVAALRVSGDPKPHIGDHRRDVHEHAGQQIADLHQLQVHPLRLTARFFLRPPGASARSTARAARASPRPARRCPAPPARAADCCASRG